jgi:hypothetical protein
VLKGGAVVGSAAVGAESGAVVGSAAVGAESGAVVGGATVGAESGAAVRSVRSKLAYAERWFRACHLDLGYCNSKALLIIAFAEMSVSYWLLVFR